MTQHSLTAFFDTRDDAANAVNKLRELGVPDTNIRLLPDVDATAPPMRQGLSDSGFLGFLGEFFGSARDADSYEEGLRRGAIMVTAQVDITQLGSATRILDEHGSIDMDERERGWIEDGWRPPEREASAGASTATLAAGVASAATGMPGAGWSPTEAPAGRGRVRVHKYGDQGTEAVPAEAPRSGTASPGARIVPGMEVIGSDSRHVGTVDRVEGFTIKLRRADAPGIVRHHHLIPLDWVSSVDQKVNLGRAAHDAIRQWQEG